MQRNTSGSSRDVSSHSSLVHVVGKTPAGRNEMYGLHNLMVIIALLSIGRFIIDNNREFGFLMSLPLQTLSLRECSYLLLTVLVSLVRCFLGFCIEKNSLSAVFIYLNLAATELMVAYINLEHIHHIYSSGWSMIFSVICTVKLISFHLVIREMRRSGKNMAGSILRLGHFSYFLVVPTLCFQLAFPMRVRRNPRRTFVRMLQLAASSLLFVFVMDQYAIPSIYRILGLSDAITVVENIINLSTSTVILFLIFFYSVFHCLLDIVADITLFYDSHFYHGWWNASSAKEFWALWNRPAYLWLRRHLYFPMIGSGVSKKKAALTVFAVSGLIHEYVISVSIKKLSGWFLISMLCQVPLIRVTEAFKHRFPKLGNFFFWATFCVIGQPSIILLYYRSLYLKEHHL